MNSSSDVVNGNDKTVDFDSNPYVVGKEAKEMLLEHRKKVFVSQ